MAHPHLDNVLLSTFSQLTARETQLAINCVPGGRPRLHSWSLLAIYSAVVVLRLVLNPYCVFFCRKRPTPFYMLLFATAAISLYTV
jgi:hypothetical protein